MTTSETHDKAVQLQELLGKAGAGLPIWLNPEKFLEPEFEPETCIADLRRYVPLATLQAELQSYLALLKTKLVEVINEDYSDYVNLSSKLVNVDGAVLRMRKPLIELKDKLNVVQEAVKGELSALNAGLKRRKEVATAKSLLELLQELAHVASKVEKLLAEVPPLTSTSAADLDARSRMLERVAGEVSRLAFQANRGKDLAFVKAMEPRIASARKELEGHLSATLLAALQQRSHPAALHCLHAYVELGDVAPAEEAFRSIIVAPVVDAAITAHKQNNPRAAAGGRDDGLAALLSGIVTSIQAEAGPVLSNSLQPQSGLGLLDFLGNAILQEVHDALAATLPGVFSPGVPSAFHSHYRAATQFLDKLESLCRSRAALDKLRASQAYSAFLRRWNLSVYFSLLYQEIAGDLEESTHMSKLEVKAGHPLGLQLAPSSALVACLQRCTAQDTFLVHLSDKFMRLVLQLGQRFVSWAAAVVAARSEAANQAAGGAPATSSLDSPGAGGARISSSGAALPGPSPAGTQAGPGLAWAAQVSVEELSVFYSDLVKVAAHIREAFASALLGLIGALPGEAQSGVRQALDGLGASVEAQASALLSLMAGEVAEKCVGVVKQLKGITATYRMTTKGPPTRHSHYVVGVLTPLRQLLDTPQVQSLPSSASKQLVLEVVNVVSTKYLQLADELLTTVRKTEYSLKRLKKNRPGEGDAGDGMSDSDKITLQLFLDVQEYGHQLNKVGMQPEELASYSKLLESVKPSSDKQLPAAQQTPAVSGAAGSGDVLEAE